MTSLDRINAIFEDAPRDRIGIVDYYWGETLKNWEKNGLSGNPVDYFFDHDLIYFSFDPRFGFEEKILDESDEYLTFLSLDGEIVKLPKDSDNMILKSDLAGMPIDFTIKTRESWEQYKHLYKADQWRLYPDFPLSGSWFGVKDLENYRGKYRKAVEEKKFKCLVFREPYECIRSVMGTDNILLAMALDPGLIKEMFKHNLNITFEMIDMLEDLEMKMDGYWIWGDIAYNKGMFFSTEMYRELLMPFHTELFDRIGRRNIYHTDGNLAEVLPLLVEAGARGINPIEIKAGNDFYEIVDTFGNDLVITGGVDVRILSTNDREKIEQEIKAKIEYAKQGKYIYHSDHSIPFDVDFRTYNFIIEKVWQYGRY